MLTTFKVTGRFVLLDENGEVFKATVYINKIIKAEDGREAILKATGYMECVYSKKHEQLMTLQQLSSVTVKRMEEKIAQSQ